MKKITGISVLCLLAIIFSQKSQAQISIRVGNLTPNNVEFAVGSTNSIKPFALGYRSPAFGFFHTSLGYRLMLNDYVGLKALVGYDRISNAKDGSSLPFKSNYVRTSFEGTFNVGQVLRFYDFARSFGLHVHTGGGISFLSGPKELKSGSMLNFTAGITGYFKFSQNFALFIDATRVKHVYQQVTFDLHSVYDELGYDGLLFNATAGACISF